MAYRSPAQEKQLKSLEQRLDATFWSPTLVKSRSTRTGGVRLSPLPASPSNSSLPGLQQGQSFLRAASQSPARRSSGRLGDLQEMRRSAPTASDWLASAKQHDLPQPCQRMAALAEPDAQDAQGETFVPKTPPRTQSTLRVRRHRKPADLGASQCFGSHARGRSYAAETEEAKSKKAWPESKSSSSARCTSVPPTGTDKADEEAAATAKMRAVAALQRLFFEEMARGGQDANEAAARALRRLTEAPSRPCSAEGDGADGSGFADACESSDLLRNSSGDVCMQRCVPRRPAPAEGRRPRGTPQCEFIKA